MWAKYHRDKLPVETSLDNLYRLQREDGFICREFTAEGEAMWPDTHPVAFAPPVLTWAELELHSHMPNAERLAKVYPHLKRHHAFCMETYRGDDGLFIGNRHGCGMDNLPRWPREVTYDTRLDDGILLRAEDVHAKYRKWISSGATNKPNWNRQGRFVDMSAQMAFNAQGLASMADLLDYHDDAKQFRLQHSGLREVFNERCWDERHQFYFDLGYGKRIPRFHVGSYWALIAGCVPENRLDGFLSHLTNPKRFGRPVPVPTLSADDPDYNPGGDYWLGSSWPPTTYMVLRGLRKVGAEELAKTLAQRYVDAQQIVFDKTGTFWENLSPEKAEPGSVSGPDFCGWAGLGPVAVVREFLNGETGALRCL